MTRVASSVSRWVTGVVVALTLVSLGPVGLSATPTDGTLPKAAADSLSSALEAYEELRRELAADRLDGLPAAAERLADALRSADDEASLEDPLPEVLEEGAEAAETLAQSKDLASARVAFGEVSRSLLILVREDPRLVEGWHVFTCPMAEGFPRWIQPTDAMANPYMGPAMLQCGAAVEWDVPARAAEGAPEGTRVAAEDEPKFEPGIPGLQMEDVRDHKFLWREIDQLQAWERGGRLTVTEYRDKVIEKTAHYLQIEGANAERFSSGASALIAEVREAFLHRAIPTGETSGVEGEFSTRLQAAADGLQTLLGNAPRHQLFAPEAKKWLLKLAFGPREEKEERESVQVAGSTR